MAEVIVVGAEHDGLDCSRRSIGLDRRRDVPDLDAARGQDAPQARDARAAGAEVIDIKNSPLVAHTFGKKFTGKLTAEEVILDKDGLKITAFEVDHDPIRPAVGYRFDYKGRSVVVSGDTALSANFTENAKGADVLVSESLAGNLVGMMEAAMKAQGIIVYTVFLVAEIKRNEDHDTFINAVTHELKTPIASMRLYLETLQSRPVPEEQRQEFYRVMLEDAERLHRTVDQVLKAGAAAQRPRAGIRAPVDLAALARECVDKAVARSYGVSAPILGTRRAAIVIDEDGIVRHRHVHALGLDFQDADELQAALAALPQRTA